ncbi:MAG: hypothetical protein KDK00_09720 [Rhodobacteraceae bacterium]|nr:hypothetical protein [Paracoccaceae bacterium]
METSIFLAQMLGPVLAVAGLAILIRPDGIARAGQEFLHSEALLLTSGLLALVTGLAMVLSHNLWVADWRVLITLFGWIALIAGASRLLLAGPMRRIGASMIANRALFMGPAALMLALGLYLSWQGFTH